MLKYDSVHGRFEGEVYAFLCPATLVQLVLHLSLLLTISLVCRCPAQTVP